MRVRAVNEQRTVCVYSSAECAIVNVTLNFHIVSAQYVCVCCVVVVFLASVTDWVSVFVTTELINYVHCRTHSHTHSHNHHHDDVKRA